MRIVLDGFRLRKGGLAAGIERYIWNLLAHLPHLVPEHHFELLVARDWEPVRIRGPLERLPDGIRMLRSPLGRRSIHRLWRRLRVPADLLLGQVDLFHGTEYFVPPRLAGRAVLTIHDLAYWRLPQSLRPEWVRIYARDVPRSVRRADRVIADSEATARDVHEMFGVAWYQLRVIPMGVDERFMPIENPERLAACRARYGLPDEYILWVGTIEPKKNLPSLLDAYLSLRETRVGIPPLVLVGHWGWNYEAIRARLEDPALSGLVRICGYVPDEDMPVIMSAAKVFVFPSLLEGFGIPLLEAMACGTPVVTSSISSCPEVVGDAASLCDPTDPRDIGAKILRVLEDRVLRQELRARGMERAKAFTWERTARETAAVYREML